MKRALAGPTRPFRPSLVRTCAGFAALAGVACGSQEAPPSGEESSITVLYDADERVFGPYWSVQAWFLMFLPLVTHDANGEIAPRLATRWESSPSLREWTFHLRPDVRWHDGVPVTAHDVKFSIELAAHPDILFDDAWHDVDSITVHNDTTLTIFYGRPKDARNSWIVYWPKHLLEGLDPGRFWNWPFWIRPVGNGPFRYVRQVPRTMVELEANPDFFAGEPAIERLILKFGRGTGITELLSGNVDALGVDPTDIPRFAEDPRFRVYYHQGPDLPWLNAIIWNHRHPVLADPRVRRALTQAIDRGQIVRVLNLPPDTRLTDVPYKARHYRGGTLPPAWPHDPERARTDLEEAGWFDTDGDGLRDRNGTPLRLTALVPSGGVGEKAALLAQAALRRVGVAMEIQPLDMRLLRGRVDSGRFDAAFFPIWNAVDGWLNWLGSESKIGYDNPSVAALLASLKETADPEVEDRIFEELARLVRVDLPVTVLYPEVEAYVVHRRVRGLESPYRGDPIQFMEHLWIEDEGR